MATPLSRRLSARPTLRWLIVGVVVSLLCAAPAACDSDATLEAGGVEFSPSVMADARELSDHLLDDPSLGLGTIRIPRIEMELWVGEGVEPEDLEKGPGHWPETALPGQRNRVVISGHRTSCGAPFVRLDELQRGDLILLVLPYGTATYEVTEKLVVGRSDVQVVAPRHREELSLTTCHPLGSAEKVLVVQAQAVSFDPSARLAVGQDRSSSSSQSR